MAGLWEQHVAVLFDMLLLVALCCSATVMGKALEEFFEEKLCRALLLSFGAVYLVYSPQDY